MNHYIELLISAALGLIAAVIVFLGLTACEYRTAILWQGKSGLDYRNMTVGADEAEDDIDNRPRLARK